MKSEIPISTGLLILAVIVCFILGLFGKKRTKQELADYYTISRPTLKKWITYFQEDLDDKSWDAKRSLNSFELACAKLAFGNETKFVMSKKQIAHHTGSNYKTVAEYVRNNLSELKISQDAWESCSIFPPSVTSRIIELLG